MSSDRYDSIINNTPAVFEIKDNPDADGSKKLKEISLFNPIDSGAVYNEIGNKYDINPDWLKAIAYMENTHGYYDAIPGVQTMSKLALNQAPSYRPMNVQYDTWKPLADKLGFTEWQVEFRVRCNVELAALVLKRIMVRVPDPSLEKIASIYNYMGREKVSDYGAQVKRIYEQRLWEK